MNWFGIKRIKKLLRRRKQSRGGLYGLRREAAKGMFMSNYPDDCPATRKDAYWNQKEEPEFELLNMNCTCSFCGSHDVDVNADGYCKACFISEWVDSQEFDPREDFYDQE